MTKYYNLTANKDKKTLNISIDDDIGMFWGTNSEDFAILLNENKSVDHINVSINSFGGSLFDGISIFNQLKEHSAKVTTSITGVAASAVSLIFMAGDERIVNTGSFLMIHKPLSVGVNNADESRIVADNLDKFQESIVDIYASKAVIDRTEINDMINSETWINGSDAVTWGFATSQSDEVAQVENKFDFVQYTNKYTAEIPTEAKQYFNIENKTKIQQVLNKLKTILNITPKNEDDMDKKEVHEMLAENNSKRDTEFTNKLDGVVLDFTTKLTEKDAVINTLNEKMTAQDNKILDLEAKGALSSIENVVDGFINEGRITPANRDFEIENLKLREGKDSFETYKNSISSRKTVVDMTFNVAHNGINRQTGALEGVDLMNEIVNITEGKELTSDEMIAAAQQLHRKNGGK